MRKNIICLMFTVLIHQLFAQDLFVKNYDKDAELKKTQLALSSVIIQSDYIVEAKMIITNNRDVNYYYIENDDQSYWRIMMKVIKVIRGSKIVVGDTLVSVWKQEYKGYGQLASRHRYSNAPDLWYIDGKSTSCLFLTDSKFPTEPIPDSLSHFKKTTFINSSIGIFAALYDSVIGSYPLHVSVQVRGLIFNYRYEWYDYLRKFKNINLPKKVKKPGKTG